MVLCAPWLEAADLSDCCGSVDPESPLIESSILAASEVLYELSGRIFSGTCTGTVRPCGDACRCWYSDCGCNRLAKAFLQRDVLSVSEVNIGGEILDASAYRLEDGFLVRLDGLGWPCCQDLAAPVGDPDTFSVTVTYGSPVPAVGVEAARVLACELVKSCVPGEVCSLPARVTSISRQGVSMVMLDPMAFLDNGRTGLYAVDLFLSTFNPQALRRPPSVWSPDLPRSVTFPVIEAV